MKTKIIVTLTAMRPSALPRLLCLALSLLWVSTSGYAASIHSHHEHIPEPAMTDMADMGDLPGPGTTAMPASTVVLRAPSPAPSLAQKPDKAPNKAPAPTQEPAPPLSTKTSTPTPSAIPDATEHVHHPTESPEHLAELTPPLITPIVDGKGLRDPDAYSGGFSLHSGPYLADNPHDMHAHDQQRYASFMLDRLEWADLGSANGNAGHGNAVSYELQADYGNRESTLWLRSEGELSGSELEHSQTELGWRRPMDAFWDAEAAIRLDQSTGPSRRWLGLGISGLAPYWIHTRVIAYAGAQQRVAVQAQFERDFFLSQRLILSAEAHALAYGQSDPANSIGSGLSQLDGGLRLRYDLSRQFSPYVGVRWENRFGKTATFDRLAGNQPHDSQWLVGLRGWF